MRILEIPVLTLEDEINALSSAGVDQLSSAYATGAVDALKWVLDQRLSPSDWIMRRNQSLKECPRAH